MGAKSTCHTDYLQIIEPANEIDGAAALSAGIEDNGRIARQFCGEVRLTLLHTMDYYLLPDN